MKAVYSYYPTYFIKAFEERWPDLRKEIVK
jgi:hypothetical protein